jgi:hypothetical protein
MAEISPRSLGRILARARQRELEDEIELLVEVLARRVAEKRRVDRTVREGDAEVQREWTEDEGEEENKYPSSSYGGIAEFMFGDEEEV